MKKKMISMAAAFMLVVANTPMVHALSPVAEVYYNVGTSSYDSGDFESQLNEAVKNKLKAAGINPKYVSIMDASADPASVTDSTYVHSGHDSWYIDNGGYAIPPAVETADYNHVQMSDNGKTLTFYGYTAPAYKDFMLTAGSPSGKKIITFDMDESKVDYHSMEGGGFLFNTAVDSEGKLSGYAILYVDNAVNVYSISGIDVTALHNEMSNPLSDMNGVTLVQSYGKGSSKEHSIKIVATDTKLNMWDNGDQTIKDLTLPAVYGNEFGPIVSHISHGCEIISIFAFDNMKLYSTSSKTLDVAVNRIPWGPEAPLRYVVNINDDPSELLDGGPHQSELTDTFNNNGAQYVGVTQATYTETDKQFIDGITEGGLHVDSEETITESVDKMADRIVNEITSNYKESISAIENAENMTTIQLNNGDTKNAVQNDITLLQDPDVTTVWSSDQPSVIAADGTVTRPDLDQPGTYVTLKATITQGRLTSEKTFTVYVMAADPAPLTKLTAAGGNGQATLSFPALKGSSSGDIVIEQSTDGINFTPVSPLETLDAASTSATVTGLENGKDYYFRLQIGSGFYTGTSNPAKATPSETYTALSAAAGNQQVTLAFPALTGASSIIVEQSTDGKAFTPAMTSEPVNADSTSAVVTGLTNGTTYSFRLTVASGKYAGLSNVVTATPSAPVAPAPVVPAPSAPAPEKPAAAAPTMKAEVVVSDQANGGKVVQDKITKLIGDNLKVSGKIKSANGQELQVPNIVMNKDGSFNLPKVAPGDYALALNVMGPNGEKLAGPAGKLTVDSNGNAKLSVDLVDPYGTILDTVTGQPVTGVNMQLYWADTELNRSKGRKPGELVHLPELADFSPSKNHNPQTSTDSGQYGWMVYADGDYYFVGEKNGYVVFDSRNDKREESFGDGSYIKDGMIHVGDSIVKFSFTAQPKVKAAGDHGAYMVGYPDGTFQTDRGITRSEVAAILSRLYPSKASSNKVTYKDVSAKNWAANAIATATQNKWMIGSGNHTFKPNQQITRAELMQILMNVYKWDAAKGSTYSDVAGHWAAPAIATAEEQGVLFDFTEKDFHPNQPITRLEVVRIFNQLLDRKPWDIKAAPKWTDVTEGNDNYSDIMEASTPHAFEQFETGIEDWKK